MEVVLSMIEMKLTKWKNRKLNIARRKMILNHYIIPLIIYFLSCWHPTSSQIKEFVALCKNFLWGGDPWTKKIAKAIWNLRTVPIQ